MKGRRVPPPVIIMTVPNDPSWEVDTAFLVNNPHITEYQRPYIPGETPEPLPPGTTVTVVRRGAYRWRGFQPPKEGLN